MNMLHVIKSMVILYVYNVFYLIIHGELVESMHSITMAVIIVKGACFMNSMLMIFSIFFVLCELGVQAAAQEQAQLNYALCMAATLGQDQEAERLLAAGAKPDAPADNFNETALHRAAAEGHINIVRSFLNHGADPGVRSNLDETVLHSAIGNNSHTCVAIVKVLIDLGIDVNSKEALEDNTCLHLIATNEYISNRYAFHIIKALIDAGACKDEQDSKGSTPMGKGFSARHQLKKENPVKACMLASRRAFMCIYPPTTKREERIVSMLLRVYNDDSSVAQQAQSELEEYELFDIHTYHIFEPYLHDSL